MRPPAPRKGSSPGVPPRRVDARLSYRILLAELESVTQWMLKPVKYPAGPVGWSRKLRDLLTKFRERKFDVISL